MGSTVFIYFYQNLDYFLNLLSSFPYSFIFMALEGSIVRYDINCFFYALIVTRNFSGYSSHVVKVTPAKFVVNCVVVYEKSPLKVIELNNVCKSSNFIIYFIIGRPIDRLYARIKFHQIQKKTMKNKLKCEIKAF